MKARIQVAFRERLELVVSDGPQAGVYSTRVQDITEAHIAVDAPVSGWHTIFLKEGLPLWVTFARENDARYRFRSKVSGKTLEPLPMILIEPPGEIERMQDREFVRVPAALPVRCAFVNREGRNETPEPFDATIVDISAGGIRVGTDRALKRGTYLSVIFDLPGLMHFDRTDVRVIDVMEEREGRYFLLCMFLNITEGMREQIVRYNLAQQRTLLRKGLL